MTDTAPIAAQPRMSADHRRAALGKGPFEMLPHGWKAGLLLTRTWQAPFTHGLTDIWRQRCEGYWERIEQRYGVILTDHRNDWTEDPDVGPVVVTFAAILWVLPATRTAARPEAVQ